MEIKKTTRGWEYNGVIFADEKSAQNAQKTGTVSPKRKPYSIPNPEKFKLVYDGDKRQSFGLFIEQVLKIQGKGILQLAKELEVSRQALFSWMNGESVPTRKNIENLLAVTECPVEALKVALADNFRRMEEKAFEGIKRYTGPKKNTRAKKTIRPSSKKATG